MSWGKPTCRDTEPWCKNTPFSTNSQGPCRGTHKISEASDNTTRIFSRNPGDPCPSILSRNSPKVFTRTFPRPDRISTSVQALRTRVNYSQGPKKMHRATRRAIQHEVYAERVAQATYRATTRTIQQVQECRTGWGSQSQIDTMSQRHDRTRTKWLRGCASKCCARHEHET